MASGAPALLAENVANADTPNSAPRDLKPLDFGSQVPGGEPGSVTLAQHRPGAHRRLGAAAAPSRPSGNSKYDVRPAGNAVNLEDEMMKVASNQMDYQAATSLYSRSLGLFNTALGKR